jgi:Zn-dependent protease/predicted transcriptional regulator
MNATIPLGRIAGVRVGVHWSVAGIVLIVAAGLAGYWLPTAFPGHTSAAYIFGGVVAALLLVCSLLGHELAHAVVARRNGVAVDGITLWLLGGIARLRGEARTAAAELRIAVIGPVASAVLAVVFGAAAWSADRLAAADLVVAVLGYMAMLNAVLAVFNLVPAAPLDGGRVLRAVLWAWRGDRYRAAVWSAWAGRGFGFLLIAGGTVQVAFRGINGLWWVLLGLFIVNVASAEQRRARVGVALSGVRARDVMSSPVETAYAEQSVQRFLEDVLPYHRHSALPLLDDSRRLRGLVTVGSLRALPPETRAVTALHQVACQAENIPLAEPDEPLAAVLPRMTDATGGRILVYSADELVGILAPSDIGRVMTTRGVAFPMPTRAESSWDTHKPPPPDWWYPGQHRPR